MVGSNPRAIRCVVVGDGAVGKTSMLLNYTTKGYSAEYVPTFYDNFNVSLSCEEDTYKMNLVDTSGQVTYDRLRTLAYYDTDLFIVCFSLVSPTSFENLNTRWMTELKEYRPNTPFMLVGTHLDLREKLQNERPGNGHNSNINNNNNNNNNNNTKNRQHHNHLHQHRHDDDEEEDSNSKNSEDASGPQQSPPPSTRHFHHRNSHHGYHSHYLRSARRRFSWMDSSGSSSSSSSSSLMAFISKRKASKWAKRHGAVSYVECSSVTGEGVDDVFQVALDHVLAPKKESYFRKSLRKFFWKV